MESMTLMFLMAELNKLRRQVAEAVSAVRSTEAEIGVEPCHLSEGLRQIREVAAGRCQQARARGSELELEVALADLVWATEAELHWWRYALRAV